MVCESSRCNRSKKEGTLKEEFTLDGIKTWKVSTPNSDPNRILLYYHGGGYFMGSPKSHYSLVSYLGRYN